MRILAIETSCDETAAAVIEANPSDKKVKLLSNIVASSLSLHAKTGGIIPEVAAREQVKYIMPVIEESLRQAQCKSYDLDAIAVTVGPGLIGSLLVGVETAKTLAFAWQKPIIPVNHLIGHIYANWVLTTNKKQLTNNPSTPLRASKLEVSFPVLALIVSGGHTDLVLMRGHQQLTWLGGTRDDAAGEAFDKIGRLLGLPYPAGPVMAKLAQQGNPKAFNFPRPIIDSNDFDFSFSGLKTAVFREVKSQPPKAGSEQLLTDLSASVQQAIVDVLVVKTIKAAQKYKVKSILLGGGVGANELLRKQLEASCGKLAVKFFAPAKNLCTDNAAMIASAAFFNLAHKGASSAYRPVPWQKIKVDPDLHF